MARINWVVTYRFDDDEEWLPQKSVNMDIFEVVQVTPENKTLGLYHSGGDTIIMTGIEKDGWLLVKREISIREEG